MCWASVSDLRAGLADIDLSKCDSLVFPDWRSQGLGVLVVRVLAGDGFTKVLTGWAVPFRIARSLMTPGATGGWASLVRLCDFSS